MSKINLFALLLISFVIFAPSVLAATYTVTNTNDSGAGRLHQAIATANSTATVNDVVFRCSDGLYTARSDDTGRERLTQSDDESPKWSSEGTRIVFSRNGEIWSIRSDGSDARQITSPQGGWWKIHPSLSPDGSKLLYVLTDWWDYFYLYLANADGSAPVRITSGDREFDPDWSPDGRRFAVAHQFGSGSPSYIYLYNADGTNPIALTGGHDRYDYSPSWSPDGNRILFVRNVGYSITNPDIYAVDVSGAGLTALANTVSYEESPTWSPDGGKIMYSQDFDIWTMESDGSNKRPLSVGDGCQDSDWRSIAPAPASIQVSGRVFTPDGRGLRNATVFMTDSLGNRRAVTTSAFGYYVLDNVAGGQTYTLGVSSKLYRFAPRSIQVDADLTLADFVGEE